MARKYEEMTEIEQKQITNTVEQQNYLIKVADIPYMCYYLKIPNSEFYKRYCGEYIKD